MVKARLIICVISDSSVNIRRDYKGGGSPQLVRLIHHMQEFVFIDEPYQLIRADLIEIVIGQIQALNTELVSVKMQLQYIEKYKHNAAFVCLLEQDQSNLIKYLAPIVYMDDIDEHAKRFDNLIYSLMLAQVEESPQMMRAHRIKFVHTVYPTHVECIVLMERKSQPQKLVKKTGESSNSSVSLFMRTMVIAGCGCF